MTTQSPPEMTDRLFPDPAPLVAVDFPDDPGDSIAGVLTYDGSYVNPGAASFAPQRWAVRASARERDRPALERFTQRLRVWLDAAPDTAELDAVMAELDAPFGKGARDERLAALLLSDEHEDDVRSVVVLETELASHAATVNWGEIRDSLNQGEKTVWTGDRKWAKMRVEGGSTDLRGIAGTSPTVTAVGASNWEKANERCSVVGKSAGLATYRMSAGWKT